MDELWYIGSELEIQLWNFHLLKFFQPLIKHLTLNLSIICNTFYTCHTGPGEASQRLTPTNFFKPSYFISNPQSVKLFIRSHPL